VAVLTYGPIVALQVFHLRPDTLQHLIALLSRGERPFDGTGAQDFGEIRKGRFWEEAEPEIVVLSVADSLCISADTPDKLGPKGNSTVCERIAPEDGGADLSIGLRH